MNRFKELTVWQNAVELSTEVYQLTSSFPSKEEYRLIQQLTRCAVSIPSNIAEGAGRETDKDFNHFLSIALGSSFELETQLIISNKLNYISKEELDKMSKKLIHLQNMLARLKKSVKTSIKQ